MNLVTWMASIEGETNIMNLYKYLPHTDTITGMIIPPILSQL